MIRVSRTRLFFLIIGLAGLIFAVLRSTSGERKASASGEESLLEHLRSAPVRERLTFEVPPGTRLHVRLIDEITERNRAGDIFLGKLDGDIEESGYLVIPRGSRVVGRIIRLGEDSKRPDATQVSLVLEQMAVGKRAIPIDSHVLTLSNPQSVPSPDNPFDQGCDFFPDQESIQDRAGNSKETTIYEADTRLTFVLAERLRLPVFVPSE
jgi:hypothetical protein